ncbi:MAG: class I SAM-dependent methyltransferase [bacterium]|nr:class I SAM-dependent methyltransferase [bacterium]
MNTTISEMYKKRNVDIRFIEIDSCPVCSSDKLEFIMRGKDSESLSLKYSIVQCPQCYVYITSPQPHPEDIWKLYDERDSKDFAPSLNNITTLRQYIFRRYINKILKYIAGDKLSVLDYGCGDGLLSLLLSQHPRCAHVTAADFHPAAPLYIAQSGANISYIPHHDFVKSSARYDLILCRQVLEHVHDPVATLGLLREHMNANAWIFVEVPNFQSIWRTIFGPNWSMLYLPRHLFHYAPCSLSAVLQRSGFEVKKLQHGHFPGMKTSLYHLLGMHSPAPGAMAVLLFPLQMALDIICRRSSVIAAYAQAQTDQI